MLRSENRKLTPICNGKPRQMGNREYGNAF